MLLKNNRKTNGDMVTRFNQFRKEIESSGQNPQELLNNLISSGKVTKSQVDNARKMASMFSYLIK